jgi:hypothetical protein
MTGRRKAAATEPQLVPLSDVAAVLIERGLWQRWDPAMPGRPTQLVADEVMENRVRLQAEQHGVAIVAGWQGRACVSAAGADLIVAAVAAAVDELRELERRDAEAEAQRTTAQPSRSYATLGETMAYMSPAAQMAMMRPGSQVRMPGVVDMATIEAATRQRLADSGMTADGDDAQRVAAVLRTIGPPTDTDEW